MFEKKRIAALVSLALGVAAGSAHAVLERVGPTSTAPSSMGYPSWYMDTTGVTTEFCAPANASEVAGGWCLLLPPDVPLAPEAFPKPFFDEHFYFAADAALTATNGGKALLHLALEGAFANGPVVPGDQVVFARVRVKLTNVPTPGTYRFIHPYGVETVTCPEDCRGGNLIFQTRDIGIGAPGDFNLALNGDLGPFLLPSATPGGPEMAPLTAANPTPDTDPTHFGGAFAPTPYPGTGKAYIADPARIGPITGSPVGTNFFRIEGPPGSALGVDPATGAAADFLQTTNFSLMGRFFTGTVPGRVLVDRASYTVNTSGNKVDVFATAFETGQPRLPGQPRAPLVAPQLSYYDAPCTGGVDPITGVVTPLSAPAGTAPIQMFASTGGTLHWGQSTPAIIPQGVCVVDASARDLAGAVVPLFLNAGVTDEVNVTSALYDRASGTLSVAATSSDESATPPILSLRFPGFSTNLVSGVASVSPLLAPPAKVLVVSSAGGTDEYQVKTAFATAAPVNLPVAANDTFTLFEDCSPSPSTTLCATPAALAVLANDSNVTVGTVAITGAPRLGTATVNADRTVSYRPNLNANGADQFTYTVTVGTQVSNTATVNVNILPVNDAPTAVNDSANAVRNWVRNVNVLANDTDPDGAADLASATLVPGSVVGGSVTCAGALCSFTPSATASNISFAYRAVDKSGMPSANTATVAVAVAVAAAEQVNVNRADYTRANGRLRLVGVTTPAMGQTMALEFVNSAGAQVGTTISTSLAVDAAGNWTFDQTGITLPAGAISVRATSSNPDNANHTVRAQALSIK